MKPFLQIPLLLTQKNPALLKIALLVLTFAVGALNANAQCSKSFAQSLSVCPGQSVTVGANTHTLTGTYIDKLTGQAVGGCDSIVITYLTQIFGTGVASFSALSNYSSNGSSAYILATGDFNGDGKADIAITTSAGNNVYAMINNGTGGFATGVSYASGSNPRGVTTGDFNGDGKIDIAVANFSSSTVSVYFGNGNGTFQTQLTYPTDVNPYIVITGDFNGDGKLDLATSNETSNDVSILLNNGTGGFAAAANYPDGGTGIVSLCSGDFNSDGKADIAMVNAGSNSITELLNNGNGTFAAATTVATGFSLTTPCHIICADFNHDGKLDLAVNNQSLNTVSVLQGNGAGAFTNFAGSPFSTGASTGPFYLVAADFNGDGNMDIATANRGNNTLGIMLGNGTGGFTATSITGSSSPWAVAVGDFNGDGKPDLAENSNNSVNTAIFLNTQLVLASAGATPASVCSSGSNSTLTLTGPVGLTTYSWSGPNSYTSSVQSPVISSLTTVASGVYTLKVTESHGCTASANTVAVTVSAAKTFSQTVTACGSLTVGSVTHTSNGTYTDLLTSKGGCDSTVTTILTIKPSSTFTQSLTVCAGQSITVGTNTHTLTGTYVDKLSGQAINGCDSIVTTNLTQIFGTGAASFSALSNYSSNGSSAYVLATGDFNGDGKADIAITTNAGNNVYAMINNGTGGFATGVAYASGSAPRGVTTGDFNGDGKIDIAVANFTSSTVSVYFGNGNGTFQTQLTYSTHTNPYIVITGDFNGDGKLDLATSNETSNDVSVLLNNGTGGFPTAANYPAVGTGIISLCSGDFNSDGKADIALVNQGSNSITELLNNGNGTFATATTVATGFSLSAPCHIICADFNHDGKLDLAVNNQTPNTVSVLQGNGAGAFTNFSGSPFSTGASTGPFYLLAADFNGDGNMDIATANRGNNTLGIMLGNGTGGFTATSITGSGSPWAIAAGDFNGDGKPDLAENSNNSVNTAIFLNTQPVLASAGATPASVCSSGSNSTLTLTGPAGLTTYSWSGPNSFTSSVQSPVIGSLTTAASGVYTLKVTESHGCTATASTAAVTVGAAKTFSQTITACGSYTVGSATHTSTNTYTDILTSKNGCDSTVTTNLTIKTIATFSQTLIICAGQSVTVGTNTYTQTGTYVDKLTGRAADGCDSTVITNLTLIFGSGAASFGALSNYSSNGSSAYILATGDFNGDGKADIAITTSAGNNVYAMINSGTGGFATGVAYASGSNPRGVTTGDFNSDGKIDIAVANFSSSTVSVYFGNGNGTFQTQLTYSTNTNPYEVITGDFNGDGKLDLATSNETTNDVSVLLNNGTGGFPTAANYPAVGTGIVSLCSGDFNGDGKADIAIANTGSNSITELLNNGNGTFVAATTVATGFSLSNPCRIICADFNHDGKLDLAVNNQSPNTVSVLQGNGAGAFTNFSGSPFSTGVSTGPFYLAAADFNGDGNLDIATANRGNSTLGIMLGNGTGGFTATSITGSSSPWAVAVGDFNGDGKPDLAENSNNSVNTAIFLNTTASQASATASPTSVCSSGSNSTLTLTGPAGLTTYSWSGPNSYTSSVQSPVISNPTTAASGVYTLKVTESHGCTASASTASVTINSAKTFSQTITACSSYTVGSTIHTGTGTFTDILVSKGGCDSTVTTNLTIKSIATFSQTLIICAGQSIIVGANIHTVTGVYTDKLTGSAANGCDSIVTTSLTVFYGTGVGTTFNTQITTGINGSPYYAAIADYNGDGNLDIATTSNNNANVWISPGNGTGGFGVATTVAIGANPRGIVAADFNGDGKMDLAVANFSGNSITILEGNGNGTFTTFSTITGITNPFYLATGDFDGDGNTDLAATLLTSGTVMFYKGNGSGSFSNTNTTTIGSASASPNSLAIADYDGDGKLDVAEINNGTNDGYILKGNGIGGFTTTLHLTGFNVPWQVDAADLNGDGKPDLVVNNQSGNNISVMLNNGTGGFGAATTYSCGTGPLYEAVGDFNGDGKPDIATANYTAGNSVSILLGNGTGGFSTTGTSLLTVGTNPWSIYSADFNNDGKPDILTVNTNNANVSVLINTAVLTATASSSTPVCPNGSLSLTGGPSGLSGYFWSGPDFYSAAGQNPTLVSPGPSGGGTYTLTVTDSHGCTGSASTPVTLKTLPSILVTPQSAVCTGGTSAILTASGSISGYLWAPTANLTPSAGTSATETAQISVLTFYTVSGTGSNGCSNTAVVPVATVATGGVISPAFSIICSGTTETLTVGGEAGHDYQWQMSTDNNTWTNIPAATNTTYTTAGGDGNTNKFYRLMAQSNSCWNVASTTAEVDVSHPVINVTATNITDNSITLNWSPTGTGNYTISYSGTSSATQTSVTPAKTITGLSSNGTYTIVVTQTGVTGCSASGTLTGVNTLCAMPTGVTLSSPANAQILVSWTGVGGADYRVYYRPLFAYGYFFTKDVSGVSSALITKQGANNLYGSTTYEVYVSRLDCPNPGDVGQGTNPTNVTTKPDVSCTTPLIDSVRSLCPVQIEVFMHPGSSPTGTYNIYLQRITPTILAVNSYGVTGNYFTINVPYSGSVYLIAADSKCSTGGLSSLYVYPGNVTVKPLCTLPNNLVLSNPTCHGFTASWNGDQCLSNSASGYNIYLRVAGTINYNSYGVPLPANGIGPNDKINFVTSGRNYQVFVRSVYKCSNFTTYGPPSLIQTITTLSGGCRDEDVQQPEETKPAVQQYSPDNQEVFSLYPNPNNGEFAVDLSRYSTDEDGVRIEVINMMGQTVVTHLTTISGGHMSEFINLPVGTAAGTYIVRLTAGKNVYTAKINVSK